MLNIYSIINLRICRYCDKDEHEVKFYSNPGLVCAKCGNAITRKYYRENREEMNKRKNKKRRLKRANSKKSILFSTNGDS